MAMQHEGPLSERATRVGNDLFWTVLPSASMLVVGSASSEHQVKRGLRELKEKKLVDINELGCLLPPVPVISWTERGLDHFKADEWQRSWLGRDGLGSLALYDFAKVEAVNGVAPLYATGGWVLQPIHFFERQPMIAAAEYRHPDHHAPEYLVFCWVSMLENQRELCERIEALQEAMQAVSMDPSETLWPSGIALLAASEWGAARALCMALPVLSRWALPRSITGWYHGSGGWHMSDSVSAKTGAPPGGMPPLFHSIRRLRPSFSVRKLGKRKLKNILSRSLWAGRGGHTLVELLTLVAIYPCGAIAHYQRLVGEKPGGTDTKKRLKRLEEMGLIEIVTKRGRARRSTRRRKGIPVTLSDRGQGAHRYATTLAGRVNFCYVHGGRPEDLRRRTKLGLLKTEIRGEGFASPPDPVLAGSHTLCPWGQAGRPQRACRAGPQLEETPQGCAGLSPNTVLHGAAQPSPRANAGVRLESCRDGLHLDATPRGHGRGPVALPARGYRLRDPGSAPRWRLRLRARVAGLDHPRGPAAHRTGRRDFRRDAVGAMVVLLGG